MSGFDQVAYNDGDTPLTGWWKRPAETPRAAVTVFPTFINATPGVMAKAEALVDAGCAAFVADFYGPEAPSDAPGAFAAMGRLRSDPLACRKRFAAALAQTRALAPDVPQVAIGFCFGGFAVLEVARSGEKLALVASFHGLLATPLPADKPISPRILIAHGDVDKFVPRSEVVEFWEEMDRVKANWHLHSYAGVDHGFTNKLGFDGNPNPAYNASADRQSWSAFLGLLDEVLA